MSRPSQDRRTPTRVAACTRPSPRSARWPSARTGRGRQVLGTTNDAEWQRLAAAMLGRADLAADPRYARNDDRVRHRRELASIFSGKTTAEWVRIGLEHDIPIGPVNTPATIGRDPQFTERMPWQPASRLGAEQLPFPVRVVGDAPPAAVARAPAAGQHGDEILADVLGYDAARIAGLRAAGALGPG